MIYAINKLRCQDCTHEFTASEGAIGDYVFLPLAKNCPKCNSEQLIALESEQVLPQPEMPIFDEHGGMKQWTLSNPVIQTAGFRLPDWSWIDNAMIPSIQRRLDENGPVDLVTGVGLESDEDFRERFKREYSKPIDESKMFSQEYGISPQAQPNTVINTEPAAVDPYESRNDWPAAIGQYESPNDWQPVGPGTPLGCWLETQKKGESGTNVCMATIACIGDEVEWAEKVGGRTTVTHHSFAAPDEWRWVR